jgi:hypothetical protein
MSETPSPAGNADVPPARGRRYDFSPDKDGYITSIHRDDGVEVPIDGESQSFCEFLTWYATRTLDRVPLAEYDRVRDGKVFFADRADLIDHLKKSSLMLHVILSDGLLNLGHMPAGPINLPAKGGGTPISFYPLNIAVASAEPERDQDEGVRPQEARIYVTPTLHDVMHGELRQDEDSDIRRLSSWPVERAFVYVDVSGFSKHPLKQQVLIINSLVNLTNGSDYWPRATAAFMAREQREASLCIGDGYIFVFRNAPSGAYFAAYFAAYLAQLIETLIAKGKLLEFHFRISVHVGPVFRFWDRWGERAEHGRWNYVGRGITEGERVLSAIGTDRDDIVFVSAETRRRIVAALSGPESSQILSHLQNRGRQKDKHEQFRRLYEVNHTAWVGRAIDRLPREVLTRDVGT